MLSRDASDVCLQWPTSVPPNSVCPAPRRTCPQTSMKCDDPHHALPCDPNTPSSSDHQPQNPEFSSDIPTSRNSEFSSETSQSRIPTRKPQKHTTNIQEITWPTTPFPSCPTTMPHSNHSSAV